MNSGYHYLLIDDGWTLLSGFVLRKFDLPVFYKIYIFGIISLFINYVISLVLDILTLNEDSFLFSISAAVE